jgi:hypothetical protein
VHERFGKSGIVPDLPVIEIDASALYLLAKPEMPEEVHFDKGGVRKIERVVVEPGGGDVDDGANLAGGGSARSGHDAIPDVRKCTRGGDPTHQISFPTTGTVAGTGEGCPLYGVTPVHSTLD